ncbi:MAG: metalloregulator ArsR/SmtB family transcription factor [Candidatus Eisenbacteria bacterium]
MNKPTPEELDLLHSELCSALHDKTRVAILYELAGGPQYVNGIVEALSLPQAAISRHLKVLRDGGIVVATREGNHVRCELQDRRIVGVLDLLREILAASLQRKSETGQRIRSAMAETRPGRRGIRGLGSKA